MRSRNLFAHMSLEESLAVGGRPNTGIDDIEEFQRWWQAARQVVAQRAPVWETPRSSPLPPGHEAFVAGLQNNALKDAMGARPWEVRLVELAGVVSFQKSLTEERIRVPEALRPETVDLGALLPFCLAEPATHNVAVQTGPGNSFVMSSPDLNLRVGGLVNAQTPQGQVFGFVSNHGLPWVQVVEWRGRYFMRDGYHRAVGLMRMGHNAIPVAFVPDAHQDDIGIRPGFFDVETISGPQPPILGDFMDDRLSRVIDLPRLYKVLRISAEELVVPATD